MSEAQVNAVIELLWDYMKRDPEHRDRVQTGWGTKTREGLVACVQRAVTPARRKAGRKPKSTPCGRCGSLCASARAARVHCSQPKEAE